MCILDNISTTKEAATGVAPCLVGENGSSAIVIVSGANLLLESREIKEAESMIKRSKIMVCQLEITEDATITALRLAKKHGGIVCPFNLSSYVNDRQCGVVLPSPSKIYINHMGTQLQITLPQSRVNSALYNTLQVYTGQRNILSRLYNSLIFARRNKNNCCDF